MAKKKKKPIVVSPCGIAVYPWLTTADTCFNEEGVYKCQLVLQKNAEGVAEFIDKINKTADGGKLPYKIQEDGSYIVSAKSGFKPAVFDAAKNPIGDTVQVYGGSKVKLAVVMNTYDGFGGGCNLYLHAVQILELVTNNDKCADMYGFGEEEGFVVEEEDESAEPSADSDEEDSSEGLEF